MSLRDLETLGMSIPDPLETEIREYKDNYNKYREFLKLWESNIKKKIKDLIVFGKLKNVPLSIVKKDIQNTISFELNRYHEEELYHTLPEKEITNE